LRENLHCCIATIEIVPESISMSTYFCCNATKILPKRKFQSKQEARNPEIAGRSIAESKNAASFHGAGADSAGPVFHAMSAATPGMHRGPEENEWRMNSATGQALPS
jgi:hypothetical protein